MQVLFVISSADSFKLEVPTVFPDMQIVRGGHGQSSGFLYQVVSVRLQTNIGRHRSSTEEVDRIVAFVQSRGTAGVL